MVDLFGDIAIVERKRRARSQGRRKGITQRRSARTPSQITIEIEGAKLEVDFLRGHKTGLYLDQKYNYGIVSRSLATGAVLDCFTNQGAFALTCARAGATEVTVSKKIRRTFPPRTKRCAQ